MQYDSNPISGKPSCPNSGKWNNIVLNNFPELAEIPETYCGRWRYFHQGDPLIPPHEFLTKSISVALLQSVMKTNSCVGITFYFRKFKATAPERELVIVALALRHKIIIYTDEKASFVALVVWFSTHILFMLLYVKFIVNSGNTVSFCNKLDIACFLYDVSFNFYRTLTGVEI